MGTSKNGRESSSHSDKQKAEALKKQIGELYVSSVSRCFFRLDTVDYKLLSVVFLRENVSR